MTPGKPTQRLLVALALALLSWGGATLVGHAERISKLEGQNQILLDWLDRVDAKLDKALSR